MSARRYAGLLVLALALAPLACDDEASAPGPDRVVARRITNAADLIGGTDPLGGIGDWYLANDVVEAIIDDPSNPNGLAPSGGNLIDYALKGQDNDQWNQVYQVFMASQDLPLKYTSIVAETEGDVGSLTVTGTVFASNGLTPLTQAVASALTVVTRYELRAGDTNLYLKTTLTNGTSAPLTSGYGVPLYDVFIWGTRSALPFGPYPGRGFTYVDFSPGSNIIEAFGAYLYVGARSYVEPDVSYGIVAPSVNGGLLPGIVTEQISALGLPPTGGTLAPGESISYSRILLISGERTIDGVARQAFAIQARENPEEVEGVGTLVGRVTGGAASRRVDITALQPTFGGIDKPMNATEPDAQGAYSMTLPVGRYRVHARFGAGLETTTELVEVVAGEPVMAPDIAAPAMATLTYSILSGGEALPARITLKGVGPATVDPELGSPFSGFVSRNVAYSADGTGTLAVEPGTYDVYASRGMEYSLAHQQVTLGAGGTESLAFTPSRVVDTTGWIAVDAHVHSGASFDSSVELEARALSMAGEGVEVAITTDHDYIVDSAPAVQALGLDQRLATIIGVETTGFVPTPDFPKTIGHVNAWPMQVEPEMARRGAPADEYVEPGEVFERLRAVAAGTPVVQLNHARASSAGSVGLGYFTNFGFDPTVAVPATDDGGSNGFVARETPGGTRNVDFDAMEVINGLSWSGLHYNFQIRDDWLSLLRQGFMIAGTANSDTHRVAIEVAGFPRSYVSVVSDTPASLDVEAMDASLLALAVIGTTGPFVTARIPGGVGIGGVESLQGGNVVDVLVDVQAAPWMPVEEVRVLWNGRVICAVSAAGAVTDPDTTACPTGLVTPADPFGTGDVVRYSATISFTVVGDGFVIVEAGHRIPAGRDSDADGVTDTWDVNGDGSAADEAAYTLPAYAAPSIASVVAPDIFPWGFTNPIRIDVAGDGWTAPGL